MKRTFQAVLFSLSTCIKGKFPILDLLIFKQGFSCNIKLDKRIGACWSRFQSQQRRMFGSLEPSYLALNSIETSNFHAKFNEDIKSFFTLINFDQKLASAIFPRSPFGL